MSYNFNTGLDKNTFFNDIKQEFLDAKFQELADRNMYVLSRGYDSLPHFIEKIEPQNIHTFPNIFLPDLNKMDKDCPQFLIKDKEVTFKNKYLTSQIEMLKFNKSIIDFTANVLQNGSINVSNIKYKTEIFLHKNNEYSKKYKEIIKFSKAQLMKAL